MTKYRLWPLNIPSQKNVRNMAQGKEKREQKVKKR